MSKKRIGLIDSVRGLCVVLMVAHHLLYDCVVVLGAPWVLFSNPVFNLLHYVFAGLFILLSGVSSRFSHSNVGRGVKTLIAALVISLVTWFMGAPVVFGVLHLLGSCMLLYGLSQKLWQRCRGAWLPLACVVLTVASTLFLRSMNPVESRCLWALGLWPVDFYSADYFPLLPWVFVFLFGTWLGGPIREEKLPRWFYEKEVDLLSKIGRHAFVIYLLHQPVLYSLTWGIRLLFGS